MKLTNLTKSVAFVAAATLTSFAFAGIAPTTDLAPQHERHMMMMDSGMFKGVEVNMGHVSVSHKNGRTMLSLSPDFVIPKAPAPSWQIVDSKGNKYLLNQLRIAGDKTNLTITLPKYIHDVAKVQIWCSFVETVLGEASFSKPVEVR